MLGTGITALILPSSFITILALRFLGVGLRGLHPRLSLLLLGFSKPVFRVVAYLLTSLAKVYLLII